MNKYFRNVAFRIQAYLNAKGLEHIRLYTLEPNLVVKSIKRCGSTCMHPPISVIIPTLCRETLFKVLDAIINNCYQGDIEILVVLGRRGVSRARNIGVLLAKHNIVLFLDDDVIPSDDALNKLVSGLMRSRKEDPAVIGIAVVRGSGDWKGAYTKFENNRIILCPSPNGTTHVLHGFSICLKDAIVSAGGYNEFIEWGFEDRELGIRLQKQGLKILMETSIAMQYTRRFR